MSSSTLSGWEKFLSTKSTNSKAYYVRIADKFHAWKEQKHITEFNENILLEYCEYLQCAPTTKFSTMSVIFNFAKYQYSASLSFRDCPTLKATLKRQKRTHKVRKATCFNDADLRAFWKSNVAKVDEYLKFGSIIAYFGWLRTDDLKKLKFSNVTLTEDSIAIAFELGKTDNQESANLFFILFEEDSDCCPATILKNYMEEVCEKDQKVGKFFKRFKADGTKPGYKAQHHGVNTLANVGKRIAKILKLANSNEYTGHCWRRSGTSTGANCGFSTKQLKRKGRWSSESMADQYIAHSEFSLKQDAAKMQHIKKKTKKDQNVTFGNATFENCTIYINRKSSQ